MATTIEKEDDNLLRERNPSSSMNVNGGSPPNLFMFWAYFTISVSVITFLFVAFSFANHGDEKSWFLSLPNDLRLHYSKGKMVKVHIGPNRQPIEVFAIENGRRDGETVVLVHGLGSNSYSFRHVIQNLAFNGVRAVVIDLPGSGFSDKSTFEVEEKWPGFLDNIWDVYSDIKEKGLFWGFDKLVETGGIPYVEKEIRVKVFKRQRPLRCGSEEMARIIGQVIDSLVLGPVHFVLHDSAMEAGTIWASMNREKARSITLIDASTNSMALPLRILKIPGIREVLLSSSWVYGGFLRFCCSRSMEKSVAEAHRVLLKGRDGRRAIVEIEKGLNYSFDLGEWAGSEVVRDLPVQILWAGNWSEKWIEEGRRVGAALPQANFVTHSGGRWPQEDAADEIAEMITKFVSSLPKSVRRVEDEGHIQQAFKESNGESHHHHGHGHEGHYHGLEPGYADAYGLDHGGWS